VTQVNVDSGNSTLVPIFFDMREKQVPVQRNFSDAESVKPMNELLYRLDVNYHANGLQPSLPKRNEQLQSTQINKQPYFRLYQTEIRYPDTNYLREPMNFETLALNSHNNLFTQYESKPAKVVEKNS
jgi:hypothetical protein